jgi:hypothetical protein
VNKSALTRSINQQWRDVVITRTARIPHRCVCREEFRSFTVTSAYSRPVDGVLSVSSTWPNLPSAEAHAAWARENRPEAEITITPLRNPNHRPGCLGHIQPGDVYADYIGEAAMAESGKPYCGACASEVWK